MLSLSTFLVRKIWTKNRLFETTPLLIILAQGFVLIFFQCSLTPNKSKIKYKGNIIMIIVLKIKSLFIYISWKHQLCQKVFICDKLLFWRWLFSILKQLLTFAKGNPVGFILHRTSPLTLLLALIIYAQAWMRCSPVSVLAMLHYGHSRVAHDLFTML